MLALVAPRAAKAIKLNWQFSLPTAGDKFARYYQRVRQEHPLC